MAVPLEIVYILPDIDAGVTSIVRNLLKHRPVSGNYYKVIFTHQIENTDNVRVTDTFNVDEQIKFEYSKKDNLFYVFNRLKKYISSNKSIIVANDGLELRMANALKLSNPLVYIIHGDFDYYYSISFLNQGIISKFISYSKYNLEKLREKLEEKNWYKLELIYYPVAENELKRKLNHSVFQVLFVGSLVERKGVDLLKPIYDLLMSKQIPFELVIIGSGNKKAELKKAFHNVKNVKLIGQLDHIDVISFYNSSHVLLLPTYSEGLPNVVVEAMKAGCIPIVSDISSGIPDIIDHLINGFLIKPGNVIEFVQAIENLQLNKNLFNQISAAAKKKANIMFEPYRQAKLYECQIVDSENIQIKNFASYPLGGVLNRKFLPNFLVKFARTIWSHPKL